MATEPRRGKRRSKELPPEFSELMNKLIEAAASFIKQFDNNEPRMRRIIERMRTNAEELRQKQEEKNRERMTDAGVGAGAGAVLTGLGIIAAPFTGGLSLVAAGAAGVAGGAAGGIVYTNVTKRRLERESVEEAEDLGKHFKKIIEPMKETLEEIKTTCEQLEQKSTETQTKDALRDMEEFKWILRRVSYLKETSRGLLEVVLEMMGVIGNLLMYIMAVFRVTSTPEKDQKLRDAIIRSADQSQIVMNKFEKMKEALREFTGRV